MRVAGITWKPFEVSPVVLCEFSTVAWKLPYWNANIFLSTYKRKLTLRSLMGMPSVAQGLSEEKVLHLIRPEEARQGKTIHLNRLSE